MVWGSALFVSTLSAFLSLRVTLDELGEFMFDTFAHHLPKLQSEPVLEGFNFVRHFWLERDTNSFSKSFRQTCLLTTFQRDFIDSLLL